MARFAPKHVAWYQRNRHHHPKFIYYFFHTLKLERYSTGSGVPTLNRNDIHSLKKFIPSLPEQQKIADFLSTVDKKIQALTRKKELLEQYKKGVMQKIFSQEIRFKPAPSEVEGKEDGSDYPEWEILRAKDLFKNYSNKNHNGNLPILAVTQDRGVIDRSSLEMKIQTSQSSINSYKLVEIGDFVISLRSFQGGIEYSNIGGICSPAYTILKPLKKINDSDSFYKYYFKKESFISQLSATVIGIREGKQISYEAFSGLKLLNPSIEEQARISSFLQNIDHKINTVLIKLNKMKGWKKGLLQKMFV